MPTQRGIFGKQKTFRAAAGAILTLSLGLTACAPPPGPIAPATPEAPPTLPVDATELPAAMTPLAAETELAPTATLVMTATATSAITPTQQAVAGAIICPQAPRPALVVMPPSTEPKATVVDLDGKAICELTLHAAPRYGLVSAGGSLFYDVVDETAQTVTIWQLGADGASRPLDFTTTDMKQSSNFGFTASPDGAKIAWGTVRPNTTAEGFLGYLWTADIDGGNQVAVLDGVEAGGLGQPRYPLPVRFSPDGSTLFYAMQPDWIPPIWTVVNGRYANLSKVPVAGGEPELLFDCNDWQLNLCVGDVAPDGGALAVTDPGTDTIDVLSPEGDSIASLPAPETGYLGPALFSPAGDLAFTSANVVESEGFPQPRPGVLGMAKAPYSGNVQEAYRSNDVTVLVQWIDPAHAVVFTVNSPEQNGMTIVSTDGTVQPIQVELSSLASFVAVLP